MPLSPCETSEMSTKRHVLLVRKGGLRVKSSGAHQCRREAARAQRGCSIPPLDFPLIVFQVWRRFPPDAADEAPRGAASVFDTLRCVPATARKPRLARRCTREPRRHRNESAAASVGRLARGFAPRRSRPMTWNEFLPMSIPSWRQSELICWIWRCSFVTPSSVTRWHCRSTAGPFH
jgi:hypothetical protein